MLWTKIINPTTGRYVKVNGTIGKQILRNYILFLKGAGKRSVRDDKDWRKDTDKQPSHKEEIVGIDVTKKRKRFERKKKKMEKMEKTIFKHGKRKRDREPLTIDQITLFKTKKIKLIVKDPPITLNTLGERSKSLNGKVSKLHENYMLVHLLKNPDLNELLFLTQDQYDLIQDDIDKIIIYSKLNNQSQSNVDPIFKSPGLHNIPTQSQLHNQPQPELYSDNQSTIPSLEEIPLEKLNAINKHKSKHGQTSDIGDLSLSLEDRITNLIQKNNVKIQDSIFIKESELDDLITLAKKVRHTFYYCTPFDYPLDEDNDDKNTLVYLCEKKHESQHERPFVFDDLEDNKFTESKIKLVDDHGPLSLERFIAEKMEKKTCLRFIQDDGTSIFKLVDDLDVNNDLRYDKTTATYIGHEHEQREIYPTENYKRWDRVVAAFKNKFYLKITQHDGDDSDQQIIYEGFLNDDELTEIMTEEIPKLIENNEIEDNVTILLVDHVNNNRYVINGTFKNQNEYHEIIKNLYKSYYNNKEYYYTKNMYISATTDENGELVEKVIDAKDEPDDIDIELQQLLDESDDSSVGQQQKTDDDSDDSDMDLDKLLDETDGISGDEPSLLNPMNRNR